MQLAIKNTVLEDETGHPVVDFVDCASVSIDVDGTLTALDADGQVVHTAQGADWDFVRVSKPLP